jgi:hypothetical protein
MKPYISNPGYEGTVKVLCEAGYHRLRQFRCSDSMERGVIPAEEFMEVWVGTKGVLIVQKWTKGNGAHVYLGWGAGQTFEELKVALNNPKPSPRETTKSLDAAEQ